MVVHHKAVHRLGLLEAPLATALEHTHQEEGMEDHRMVVLPQEVLPVDTTRGLLTKVILHHTAMVDHHPAMEDHHRILARVMVAMDLHQDNLLMVDTVGLRRVLLVRLELILQVRLTKIVPNRVVELRNRRIMTQEMDHHLLNIVHLMDLQAAGIKVDGALLPPAVGLLLATEMTITRSRDRSMTPQFLSDHTVTWTTCEDHLVTATMVLLMVTVLLTDMVHLTVMARPTVTVHHMEEDRITEMIHRKICRFEKLWRI